MKFATVAAIRYIEEQLNQTGVTFARMMTEAGEQAAQLMREQFDFTGKRVTVLCGRGNNGGDGFVVADRLHQLGAQVTVLLWRGEPTSLTAAAALAALSPDVPVVTQKSGQLSQLLAADYLVDGLYGVGFSGDATPEDRELFRQCAQSRAVKIALDLPSGVEGDSGRFSAFLAADYTIAMSVYKAAHLVSWAPSLCGKILLAETSITRFAQESGMLLHTLEPEMCALPPRLPWGHKGDNGRLAVVCGSRAFTGAAVLACGAALRSGVGYVHLLSTAEVCGAVSAQLPEVIYTQLPENEEGGIAREAAPQIVQAANRCTAVLFGCGLGDTPDTAALLDTLLEDCQRPLLLDADGLRALRGQPERLTGHIVVATPHYGEFLQLAHRHIDECNGDCTLAGARLSAQTGIALLLKGAVTAIFRGKRQPVFSFLGNDGLAKGGSGDVLAGVIASLLAQRATPEQAALTGAWLHGSAANLAAEDLGMRSMLPSDLIDYLCEPLMELESL